MSHCHLIYFSRAKENYVGGEVKMLEVGNTKRLAAYIGAILGVNGMKIVPIKDYPESYDVCIKQAKQELKLNMR